MSSEMGTKSWISLCNYTVWNDSSVLVMYVPTEYSDCWCKQESFWLGCMNVESDLSLHYLHTVLILLNATGFPSDTTMNQHTINVGSISLCSINTDLMLVQSCVSIVLLHVTKGQVGDCACKLGVGQVFRAWTDQISFLAKMLPENNKQLNSIKCLNNVIVIAALCQY